MPSVAGNSDTQAPTFVVSAAYVLHLVAVVRRFGVTGPQLLEGFDLSEDVLLATHEMLPLQTSLALLERARVLTGERGLGFHLGLQARVAAQGLLGFAMMTAANLRQAIELGVQFAPTQSNAIGVRLQTGGGTAALVVEERASLGAARDAVLVWLMLSFAQIGKVITGRELTGVVDYAFDEPDYFARWNSLAPGEARFRQQVNRLVFDGRLLEVPLVMADPLAMRLATEQCERELAALSRPPSFVARVRSLILARGLERAPTIDELASRLATSSRTLKRKLEQDKTTYSQLVEEVRHGQAIDLLRTELSVAEVAERLGYSDAANFTRAFRRWTGRSPRAFRDASKAETTDR